MKQISRRQFLKGSAAAGLGAAAAIVFGLNALAEETEATGFQFTPGTYTATAYGNLSDITVQCTFSETALLEVEILDQGETPALFGQVQDQLIPAIIENQAGGDSLCTGDGILMTSDAGATLCKTFGYCPCEYGGTNSKASRPAKQDKYDQNYCFKFGLYGNLLVDAEGQRFINEGLLCDYPMSYGSEQILLNAPWYLSKVQTPPFYVVQCEPSAWSTFGGIRTDEKLRPLTLENQPMQGLYVVGTDNGSLYYSPYYDVPSYCYGLCIDSGYIAAKEACEYIK